MVKSLYQHVALPLAAILLTTLGVSGQTVLDDTRDKVVLKWAPLSMLDYYNTFQVGAEIPFSNPRFSFQQEFGYGHSRFNVWFAERDDVPDRHIFRSRSQFRYYFKEWNSFRLFAAAEFALRRSRTFNAKYIGVDCDGECSYFRETEYTTERLVNALHGKFGFQTWLSRRVSLDVYTGFGLRTVKNKSLTPGISPSWDDDGGWWDEPNASFREPSPSFVPGFQIGIRLGKIRSELR